MRLAPGEDLTAGLRRAFEAAECQAMAVVTCVGSLSRVRLRYAGCDAPVVLEGPFEITALVGTIDRAHQHLHITLADGTGAVTGGHLLPGGSAVFTTAEIVIVTLPDLRFSREACAASGYDELVVRPR